MLTIQPQYLSLTKLLDGRLFKIPEYQRAYSWTRHQREDLFSDVRKLHKKGGDDVHFMAAVVTLRREKLQLGTDEFQVLEVVDGQQRLTTLVILLKSVELALDAEDRGEGKLRRELEELLVKPDGDELLLLQTNHDSSHYFANFLRKGLADDPSGAKTTADKEILQAIAECRAFVGQWRFGGESLVSLAALLKNRLYLLLHEIDQEKTVYTVFEVLNSRGLTVSWLDRLKSILMGMAFEAVAANGQGVIKDLHTTWRDIYSTIGLRQGLSAETLRFAATLRTQFAPSRPLSEEDSVELLRSQAARDMAHIREVAGWLLEVTRACDELVANVRLNAVTRISQARLLAVAIQLRNDLKKPEKQELLALWEKVTFRIYGMIGHDARTGVGDYVRLAWQVSNGRLAKKDIAARIKAIGGGYPIGAAIDQLREANCYEGWEGELRYLMFRYEEHLAATRNMKFRNEQWERIWSTSASESIEHILPRSRAAEKHKHRLGNLVLLPPRLNSQLGDKLPREKSSEYRRTGLLIASAVADVIDRDGWGGEEIAAREDEILRWTAMEWGD